MEYLNLKKAVYQHCTQLVEEKIRFAQEAIDGASETSGDSTKSSAGDKYETTVELMQIERNKFAQRLEEASKQKMLLNQIKPDRLTSQIELGSLVYTNIGNFFFSVSLGNLVVKGINIFAVTLASPIGRAIVDKMEQDAVEFNGREVLIQKIY